MLSRQTVQESHELERTVRTNTVHTLAELPTWQLIDYAEKYQDDPFMIACVGEAATIGLLDIDRSQSQINVSTLQGKGRNFGERLLLLGERNALEYIQAFAAGESNYLPLVV